MRLSQRIINRLLSPLGLVLVTRSQDELVYQHDYGNAGYSEYCRQQVFHNKRKFQEVWADERTLETVARDIQGRGLARRGMCHGARNGWEVEALGKRLGCPVAGTDISETAETVPNVVQHDFHDVREEWIGQFSFIYTNSLDQAFDPEKALAAWSDQLEPDGAIYVEHSMASTSAGACEMDPFGAHPMVMPYLLFEWGRSKYRLEDILHVDKVDHKHKGHVWIFVIQHIPEHVVGVGDPSREHAWTLHGN